jgi:hypothetical protein
MTWYPYNPAAGQELQTSVPGVHADRAFVAHIQYSAAEAVAANTTGIHAAHTDDGAEETLTTGITNPPCARTITATAGGVAGDIKAIQVTITGTDLGGDVITEDLPAFTVDTAGSVEGALAFATVTEIVIPAHDGNGATTAIGFGQKMGLPYLLQADTVIAALHNNTRESVAPTVTTAIQGVAANTIELDTNLDGHAVDVFLLV